MIDSIWSVVLPVFLSASVSLAIVYFFMSPKKSRSERAKLRKAQLIEIETLKGELQKERESRITLLTEIEITKTNLQKELETRETLEKDLLKLNTHCDKKCSTENDSLKSEIQILNNQIQSANARLQQAEIDLRAQSKALVESAPQDAPDYPLPQSIFLEGSTSGEWRYAFGSVHGNGKTIEQCQDSSRVVVSSDRKYVILTVADGAGSRKLSKYGSEIAVFAASESALADTENLASNSDTFDTSRFADLSYNAFKKAYDAVIEKSINDGHDASEYASTLILLIAGPDFTACAHIGDGRAGCCLRNGHWVPLLTPMKGREANMTRFLTDLGKNSELVQSNFIPLPSSAVFCISDGCETASWFTKTKPQYNNHGSLVDPNLPSAVFWSSIANTLVKYSAEQISENKNYLEIQENINKVFSDFLHTGNGNAELKKEKDDKSIALAVNLL